MKAGRKLKEKAAHARTREIGNVTKVAKWLAEFGSLRVKKSNTTRCAQREFCNGAEKVDTPSAREKRGRRGADDAVLGKTEFASVLFRLTDRDCSVPLMRVSFAVVVIAWVGRHSFLPL